MEAKTGNSILDFETLFSDFQEILNGSGLNESRNFDLTSIPGEVISIPGKHLGSSGQHLGSSRHFTPAPAVVGSIVS